jgi:MurNAc alpha-1-phosphate uridylyltransferase
MADAVMIFAAGFGTRMGALTRDRPKPLLPVAGRTLLDRALDLAEGVPRRVVNTHYLGEQVAAHLAGRPDVLLSPEAPEILETGGGLRQALPLLAADPVFTLNPDAVWTGPNPLDTLRAGWRDGMEALLLLVPSDRARGHSGAGDFEISPGGRLRRGPGAVYTGAQILRTGGLAAVPDRAFSLNLLWDGMAARGTLHGVLHPGGWCDVGRPEGIALAEAMLREAGDD